MDPKPRGGRASPEILRPIPRRPFKLNFSSPTPPDDSDDNDTTAAARRPTPNISVSDLRFLDPSYRPSPSASPHPSLGTRDRDRDTPLSRAASFLNLTSSTLFGIYAPSPRGEEQEQEQLQEDGPGFFGDTGGANTPRTPARPAGLDEETYVLMRKRSRSRSHVSCSSLLSPQSTVLALVLRAVLLFVLGVGYGVLVTRFPRRGGQQQQQQQVAVYEWWYLGFWGVAGVVLGGLLPWFDKVWERRVAAVAATGGVDAGAGLKGKRNRAEGGGDGEIDVDAIPAATAATAPAQAETDWALVIRGIGAFVGIVFAIRKLPWASTMQVSLTLALTNPFLWYLIDRSKPGFLLSAAVGLAGSLASLVMGVNTDMMMPAPAATSVPSGSPGAGSGSLLPNMTAAVSSGHGANTMGGLASQETVEASIWMLSVLFCSCVCFGNIGRRLALNSSAAGRGRWGGVR
ncbi:Insulin-induced gene 2 protein [Madurella mycetomatis]|uniref:Insulin-induced gene 2 protein n=1 Tax=Madurella mycetomatis TaxID=100816 RepID=A0A175W957_9PEZI|nr:Insulin-induced gene 2 protein [Madurella mycetomatis]